jgi:hypothetical protein
LNLSNPNDGRGPILAAGIEGETRTLTLHLAVVFLSRAGFKITFLGPDLPWPAFIDAVRRVRPAAVLLSATNEQAAETLGIWLDRLATLQDESGIIYANIPVCYNGRIFVQQPSRRDILRANFLGPAAQDSVSVVEAAIRNTPHLI